MRLAGKYNLHADEKGRLRVPSNLRDNMPSKQLYAMYSAGGCLSIVTEEEADKLFTHFESMVTVADTKDLKAARVLMGFMGELKEDSQGRFVVPAELKKMAEINKDVVFVGMGKKVELWDAKRFEENLSGEEYDYPHKEKFEQLGGGIVF